MIKKEAPIRKTPLAQEYKPRGSQFNATPRFNVASTPRPTATQKNASATPSASRYLTPGRNAQTAYEQIEKASSDDRIHDVNDSIESGELENEFGYISDDLKNDYVLEEPSPKRRRLSSSSVELKEEHSEIERDHEPQPSNSSSLQILSSPPAPRRGVTSRFLTPAPPSTPADANQSTFRKPPPFKPPDPSEQAASQKDPLPDHFSPQKGGRKYTPGGLAAELQGWLVNMESAIPSNAQRNWDDPWLVKIVVDEVSGGARSGMTMIRGRQIKSEDGMIEQETETKVILAGEGTVTGLQRVSKVEVGNTVGVKGPVWEVTLEGEKWGVGVDWKVLPD